MEKDILEIFKCELLGLEEKGILRHLPAVIHQGEEIRFGRKRMLNLSSNDYLGLATDISLREEFLQSLTPDNLLFTSSSSRLLTGNFNIYTELENQLSRMFGSESALVFNSGYHMNTGILPAICNSGTLILADKLVHASLIDGIRLSGAKYFRYHHADYNHLDKLLEMHSKSFERIIIVTESIFSMDGDVTDLHHLVRLKQKYSNVLLYVDEAHAVGIRGEQGLGCAEEQGCIPDIDFLTGTFGKALASVGGYIICRKVIRDYLINKMRTLIFTTALPPINLMWSKFVMERLNSFSNKRKHLKENSSFLKERIIEKGYNCPSESHIIPLMIGDNKKAILKAEDMWRKGFYMLPVRPPTVPEGTARIRISLTANITREIVNQIADSI
ncbi:MAG: 8-amino-7-oxononanoate synthase [Tannerellaceae bacterium]|jgi:8-amino-7-oxononanoate synthase|nr:8-amino-7-oxononanoate synthase [Tannerellaceae bacterium]